MHSGVVGYIEHDKQSFKFYDTAMYKCINRLDVTNDEKFMILCEYFFHELCILKAFNLNYLNLNYNLFKKLKL